MNVDHDNIKMIHVSVRAQYHHSGGSPYLGLGTLASGIRMGKEAASWWQLKKFSGFRLSYYFSPFFSHPYCILTYIGV